MTQEKRAEGAEKQEGVKFKEKENKKNENRSGKRWEKAQKLIVIDELRQGERGCNWSVSSRTDPTRQTGGDGHHAFKARSEVT